MHLLYGIASTQPQILREFFNTEMSDLSKSHRPKLFFPVIHLGNDEKKVSADGICSDLISRCEKKIAQTLRLYTNDSVQ